MDQQSPERQPTLLANTVSLAGDWVASVAKVAPSSTVAFTLALLLLFAGLASPLAVVVAGVGMLLVAVGYARLNKLEAARRGAVHLGGPGRPSGSGVRHRDPRDPGGHVANIGNITLAGTYLLGIIAPGSWRACAAARPTSPSAPSPTLCSRRRTSQN